MPVSLFMVPSIRRTLASILFAFAALVASAQHGQATDINLNLTPQEWRDDLHFLAAQMPLKHLSLFHTMTPAEFNSAVAKLDADIPTLNNDQIYVRFLQLVALVQDGHTGVDLSAIPANANDRIPVRFDRDAEGIYVRAAAPNLSDIIGGKVVQVGGVDWKEAIARVDSTVPHDPHNNGEQLAWSARRDLNRPRLLHGLGLSNSPDSADFVIEKNGKSRTVHLIASTNAGMWFRNTLPTDWIDARPASLPVPFLYQHGDRNYWFTELPEQRAIYFQFNAVLNDATESIPDFTTRLNTALDKPGIDRLVIDMRNNSGGDNTTLRPLLVALIRSHINQYGKLFVLIGPVTFSAAESFINRLSNYAEVTFVGQPSGENVNQYGDTVPIPLPHSHLKVNVSHLFWQDMDPRDKRPAMYPDIAVEPSFRDYLAGTDPALTLALTSDAPESIEDALTSAAPAGLDAIVARYNKFVADPIHKFVTNPEARVNTLGYTLLRQKHMDDALLIFRANVRTHPNSANAWDSLGEALLAAGQKTEGLEAYKKSLELNPENANAKRILDAAATP